MRQEKNDHFGGECWKKELEALRRKAWNRAQEKLEAKGEGADPPAYILGFAEGERAANENFAVCLTYIAQIAAKQRAIF